jgi:uncharacterized protein DUF6152
MTRGMALAAAGFAVAMLAVPVQAHHAIQANINLSTSINTKAIITRIDWINPHIWMRFDLLNADGTKEKNVMIETLGIAALRQIGIDSKAALSVGGIVDITYYPNRDGAPGGFMTRMILPDGKTVDVLNLDPTAIPLPAAPRTQ